MRRTTTLGLALAGATLLLSGCSTSSSQADAKPTDSGWLSYSSLPPATVPATMPPLPKTGLAVSSKTAACWLAIRDQYTPGTVQLTGAPTTPPACAGLSSDEVSAIAEDVLAHQLG